jgi:hypothetical protein
MSVLKSLESRIAGLVEGAFGRAFKSEVRPVEIARKLVREMEQLKSVSVSRTYVPNEYVVWLSPQDRAKFGDYEDALAKELSGYLLEHARGERLALLSRPRIEFETDDRLSLGEFGIQARLVRPAEEAGAEEPVQGEQGHTMIYSTAARVREPLEEPDPARAPNAVLLVDGKRIALGARGAILGRSRNCDVVLTDANVSRQHAEVRLRGDAWTIADLGSTNGVVVNGSNVRTEHKLAAGDRIELGTSRIVFELS